MPRTARVAPGGMVYHVVNRGVGRQPLFFHDEDFLAFERVSVETLEKRAMRVLGYCLMPNHWHFVLWPENDGDLGWFMQRLTVTHVTRWQKNYNMLDTGTSIKADTSPSRSRPTITSIKSCGTANETLCVPILFVVQKNGHGAVCGSTNMDRQNTTPCFRHGLCPDPANGFST